MLVQQVRELSDSVANKIHGQRLLQRRQHLQVNLRELKERAQVQRLLIPFTDGRTGWLGRSQVVGGHIKLEPHARRVAQHGRQRAVAGVGGRLQKPRNLGPSGLLSPTHASLALQVELGHWKTMIIIIKEEE